MTSSRLKGLEQDLHLTGFYSSRITVDFISLYELDIQYNITLAVLYASSCTVQIQSIMVSSLQFKWLQSSRNSPDFESHHKVDTFFRSLWAVQHFSPDLQAIVLHWNMCHHLGFD